MASSKSKPQRTAKKGEAKSEKVEWEEDTRSWVATGINAEGERVQARARRPASAVKRLGVRSVAGDQLEGLRFPPEAERSLRAIVEEEEELERRRVALHKRKVAVALYLEKHYSLNAKNIAPRINISVPYLYQLIDRYRTEVDESL